jgi:hypothetical protein
VLGASVVLEKVSWFEALPVQAALALGFVSVFLVAVAALPVAAIVRRWRGRPRADGLSRRATWLAFLVAVLNLAFVGGLAALVAYGEIDYGMPSAAGALFVVPFVSAVLTAGLVVCCFQAWRSGSPLGRTVLTLFTALSVGFLLLLNSWNLIGFKY